MPFTIAGFHKLKEAAQQIADEEQVSFYLQVPGVGGEPIAPRITSDHVLVRKDYLDGLELLVDTMRDCLDRLVVKEER